MKISPFIFCTLIFAFNNIFECYCLNIDTSDSERPGKDLCINQDIDCSNQVTSISSRTSCLMRYLNRTSAECDESEFKGDADSAEKYGVVNLSPFPWFDKGFIFPAINVTFEKIGWERLKMRFVKVGSQTPQICREFLVSEHINISSVISFDCLWDNGTNAGLSYRFQYVLTTRDGYRFLDTYLLRLPTVSEVDANAALEDYHMFMMMDQTKFPLISLKVQVPPARLNITSTVITLFYKQDLNNSPTKHRIWKLDLTNKQEGHFITVGPFDTNDVPGYYYFNASNYCKETCIEASTPQLLITGSRPVLQLMIAFIIIITSALSLLCFLVLKRKQKKIQREKSPNILFVYESSFPSHIENIYKFKGFLEDNCYVATKLDLIDIPKSDSMNPWRWYYKAFEEADYVLVFASPTNRTEKGIHEDNVYHNLHTYALKLLIVYLLHKHRFSVASVRLPDCCWDTLPPEALIVEHKFSLPEHLINMLKFLKVSPLKNGSSLLVTALQEPRSPPQLTVCRPDAPLELPFDTEDFELDNEIREPLNIRGVTLTMGDDSSSEEEDEEGDFESGLALGELKLSSSDSFLL